MSGNGKIIRHWPQYLTSAQTTSEAPAVAEVMQSLAGANRWLHEFARGVSGDDGTAPAIGRNPQGTYGHDHSGPPYGTCFQHDLCGWSWSRESTGGPFIDDFAKYLVARFWVRPWAQFDGAPYSRAYLSLVWLGNATGTATTADVRFLNSGTNTVQRAEVTSTISATANTYTVTTLSTAYADLVPGWNQIKIVMSRETGTDEPYLQAATLFQSAKRSH